MGISLKEHWSDGLLPAARLPRAWRGRRIADRELWNSCVELIVMLTYRKSENG